MKPYPVEFREQVLRAMAEGLSTEKAARRYGVSVATIMRWQRQREEAGNVEALPHPGRPRLIAEASEVKLHVQLLRLPEGSLAEHCAAWADATGVMVSPCTMSRALRRLGWRGRRGAPPARRRSGGAGGHGVDEPEVLAGAVAAARGAGAAGRSSANTEP